MILATEKKPMERSFDRKTYCERTTDADFCQETRRHNSQLQKDLGIHGFHFKSDSEVV